MVEMIMVLGIVVAIYLAWNIGANDLANAMASAVGAKAITLRQAVVIGGVLDFLGAVLIGSHVTATILHNILDTHVIKNPMVLMLGLLAALLSAAFWMFVATWSRLPVSDTHSIVGAMVGFGLIAGGMHAIYWGEVTIIGLGWILSPLLAGALSYYVFIFIRQKILRDPQLFRVALRWTPVFSGVTLFIIIASLLTATPLGEKFHIATHTALLWAGFIAVASGISAKEWMAATIVQVEEQGVEEIFRQFQILTSCYVALAHGANDVANAVGPMAGIYILFTSHMLGQNTPVPMALLILGAAFTAIGVFTWGYRVIDTLGSRITSLNNPRGFAADFGTATSVLVASKMGLPVATTHAAVGAIVGVGLTEGLAAVDRKVIGKIVLYWVITLPLAAIPTMIIFKLLAAVFL